MQPAHNADFCRLSISKHPANAHKINIIRRWDSQWGSGSKVVGEKDQNFSSDYFFVFYSIDKECLGLKKSKISVIIRTNVCDVKIIS